MTPEVKTETIEVKGKGIGLGKEIEITKVEPIQKKEIVL